MAKNVITKETIKLEIDQVENRYLETLYRIIKSFETQDVSSIEKEQEELDWHNFIARTYGSLADDPISRYPQGDFEVREEL